MLATSPKPTWKLKPQSELEFLTHEEITELIEADPVYIYSYLCRIGSMKNVRLQEQDFLCTCDIEERYWRSEHPIMTRENAKCTCQLGTKIKLTFPMPDGGSEELVFKYTELDTFGHRLYNFGVSYLRFKTKTWSHDVVLQSEDARFMYQVYHTLVYKHDMYDARDSIIETYDDITKSERLLNWAEYEILLDSMETIRDFWVKYDEKEYDCTGVVYELLRCWLVVRSRQNDELTEEFEELREMRRRLEKLRSSDFPTREEIFFFEQGTNAERKKMHLDACQEFTNLVEKLTPKCSQSGPEVELFVVELLEFWKWTGIDQKPIKKFLMKFVKMVTNTVEDLQQSVHIPNIVAAIMFRVTTTNEGLDELLNISLDSSADTSKLAAMNIGTIALMGLTSLYMDNEPGSKFNASCIIDCARIEKEIGELKIEEVESTETDAPSSSHNNESATEAPARPFIEKLVESSGDLDFLALEDFLNSPQDDMLADPELKNQKRQDYLTCLWFYCLDKVQHAQKEVVIDRILNAFPFYESALKDIVFRTCLAKIAGKHKLALRLPEVEIDEEVDYDPQLYPLNIRKTIEHYLDLKKLIDSLERL